MKDEAYQMAMLFDFYGDLLTARQREFFDLYYNEDLSLAEIAENYDITRQGVRDIIVRAEHSLEDIEEKTGLVCQFFKTKQTAAALRALCARLRELNQSRFNDKDLSGLASQLDAAIDDLERE